MGLTYFARFALATTAVAPVGVFSDETFETNSKRRVQQQ